MTPTFGRPYFRDLLLTDDEEDFTFWGKVEGIGRPLGTADLVTDKNADLADRFARSGSDI